MYKEEEYIGENKQSTWYTALGFIFLLFIFIFIGFFSYRLYLIINDAKALPVDTLMINGDLKLTTIDDLKFALADAETKSFFNLNVAKVQKTLNDLPWVYNASVRLEWPNKLKVQIIEQDVLAHWNDEEWVNKYGDVFIGPKNVALEGLPYLKGPKSRALDVINMYNNINDLLKINGLGVMQLELSSHTAWIVVLKNGIKLNLGKNSIIERVQKFIYVLPTLKEYKKEIKVIDLRYDTGLAVQWKEEVTKENE